MSASFPLSQEPRPRDFSARFKRSRMRSLAASRRTHHGGRLALVLLGAVTLPAFAAPGQWQRFQIGNAGQAEVQIEPMPFEKPGSSFPGSAFYYLDTSTPAAAPPPLGQGIHSDADDPQTGSGSGPAIESPAARPMHVDDSNVDHSRALRCLTAAVYYEAASEPDAGQRAVAQVVLNRVAHPAFPDTVCGVVYQGSERSTGCQFTFTCDGSLARKPNPIFWERAKRVARAALAGYVYTPVGLATHYHTVQVHPAWSDKLDYILTIGAHRFYRFEGPAGRPATFHFAYGGGEPVPGPHLAAAAGVAESGDAADPVQVQRAYEAGLKGAQDASLHPATMDLTADHAAPAPAYTRELRKRGGDALYRGDRLPGSTGIKPEYETSGRWIAKPGS